MRVVIELLRRFQSDERGVFAVLFGVMAIVLVATAGAVVDFTSIEQARARAQQALDSAALGLQPTIYTSGVTAATIKPKAQQLITERLNDSSIAVAVDTPVINTTEGTLRLSAAITVKTAFVQLVGVPTITARITSEATRKQLNLEVAMVLDNSGSMGSSGRMTNLQLAARCATDVLFSATTDCSTANLKTEDDKVTTNPNVKIAIVPFTEFVNVGTGYKTAAWMDQFGTSKVARDGFVNDSDFANIFIPNNVNRFTLYNNLKITWKGCVEARNHTLDARGNYYDTSDSPPDISVPDSLFTPTFAPDQPTGYANDYISDTPAPACRPQPTWVWTQEKDGCSKAATGGNAATNYDNCTATPVNTYTQTVNGVTTSSSSMPPAKLDKLNAPSTYTDAYSSTTTKSVIKNTRVRTYSYLPDRVLQERLCKYVSGATVSSLSSGPGGRTGPNADCPATSLLPLTAGTGSGKKTIIDRIKAMVASGGTNIHQGVMWGFHALSPNEPLPEAKSFDSATSKAMIMMTDGENTHSYKNDFAGADWYTAYGYPYNGRLTGNSTTTLQTVMDERTKATCANAKATGIVIYTIGLSAPNQTTIDMLKACASGTDKAYFPTQSSELVGVFKKIADELANLRLAK